MTTLSAAVVTTVGQLSERLSHMELWSLLTVMGKTKSRFDLNCNFAVNNSI